MENATVKGRVIALTHVMSSGIEVMPGGMPRAGGAYHAMDVAISGQPVTMSGQNVNVTSGNVQISGVVLISGRVDLATKIAGEDILNDVLKVVIASGYPVTISGSVVNISGAISGAVVNTSGQATIISGQQVRISGQETYFQSGAGNIRSSGQSITINQAQLKSGLQCVSGRQMLTDIITDVEASSPPSLWRVMIAVGNAGQLNAKIKNTDCVSGYSATSLNEGTDLTSGALYMFDVINQSGDKLNLTYNTSAPIQVLRIHEITAGTQ